MKSQRQLLMGHPCPRWTHTRVWEVLTSGLWAAFHYRPQRNGALEAIKAPGSLSVWKDDTQGAKKRNLISRLSLLRGQGQADTAPNQYSSGGFGGAEPRDASDTAGARRRLLRGAGGRDATVLWWPAQRDDTKRWRRRSGGGGAELTSILSLLSQSAVRGKKATSPLFLRRLDLNFRSWQRMQKSCCPNRDRSGALPQQRRAADEEKNKLLTHSY